MFCYQCEQAARGVGCTAPSGTCGKDTRTAALQDLLVYAAKGVAMYAHRAAQLGAQDARVNRFVVDALFSTVTNVNFDPERLAHLLWESAEARDAAAKLYRDAAKRASKAVETPEGPAAWQPAPTVEGLVRQSESVSLPHRLRTWGPDLTGLRELVLYGLKGAAAYAHHAAILGWETAQVYAAFHEHLNYLAEAAPNREDLLARALQVGALNLKVMEMLDTAHTRAYGDPVPTRVRISPVRGKAILISGHDLRDLQELLKQTQGRGVNVYTHGEMLPAHGYPRLKACPHLIGNYGGAWQDQVREFEAFPGAILMTTNCLQRPRETYRRRLFTSGLVAWPGVTHIADRNFEPVIRAAREAPGFAADEPERFVTVGFGHAAVLARAGEIAEAVRAGRIRHFFLIGGCDGAKPGRNYYTAFAEAVPEDCVILTLACGKYRFHKLDFGEVAGIPRLLDIGQCNDAYSAIRIVQGLAQALGCDVNDLPLSLVLSWFEQKAVAVLLTLLHLGLRDIRLGPTLPAFLTPEVFRVLSERFNLMPTRTAKEDLQACLREKTRRN